MGRQLDYWRGQLAGLPDVIDLPADRPRPAVAGGRGAALDFDIPPRPAGASPITRHRRGHPFMVVHSALAVLLARLAATDDIAIGTPVAGRGQRVLDPLVGMFVNTLILRTRVDGSLSFAEFVDRTAPPISTPSPTPTYRSRRSWTRWEPFARRPSRRCRRWLSLNRSVLPELADADAAAGEIAGLKVSAVGTDELPAKVDLLVGVGQADDGPWYSSMVYATDLFDESTVRIFADQLLAILDAVLDNPDIAVGDIELGSGASVLTRPQPLVNAVAPVGAADRRRRVRAHRWSGCRPAATR